MQRPKNTRHFSLWEANNSASTHSYFKTKNFLISIIVAFNNILAYCLRFQYTRCLKYIPESKELLKS